jgi:hypothetical protein
MNRLVLVLLGVSLLIGLPARGQVADKEVGISGKWKGFAVNSDGGASDIEFLDVKEKTDGTLTGKCGNRDLVMTIEKGERVTPEVVQWEASDPSAGVYRYRGVQKGKVLQLEWTHTRKEDGKVKWHTGTVLLVRE